MPVKRARRRLQARLADLCEALENAPLIYELDLVRPERTGSVRLREKIAREGVRVFPEEIATDRAEPS